MRFIAIAVLGVIVALNVLGFAFLAFAWFIDLDVQVRGGAGAVVVSAVVTVACLLAISRLRRPVASAVAS